MYPLGGETALGFGLLPEEPGTGISLTGMDRVVDFPARDLTVTVEAGLTLESLSSTLEAEGLCLPLHVPQATAATVGGMVATNSNGPGRYGFGTVRDYVIGIHAVDGMGTAFQGGGRVVKNVAGYDLCKLLTGSLGTLAIINQVTFKLKPIPGKWVSLICPLPDWETAESCLAGLVHSETTPVAVELLAGPLQSDALNAVRGDEVGLLAVCCCGTEPEVDWMQQQLQQQWQAEGLSPQVLDPEGHETFWNDLVEFPAAGEHALTLQASLVPSGVVDFVQEVRKIDPEASILAHAGNGLVVVKMPELPKAGLTEVVVSKLQPLARQNQGNVVVLSSEGAADVTHRSVWGGTEMPFDLMARIKERFDPKNLLNPGRFVYP
jgi:glycolate oxidase FAD binding subunit